MTSEWQRFKTTRLYLHPPKAERLITVWREGKIMLGEVEFPINRRYETLTAAGIWFLWGDYRQADFKESQFTVREDGIPVHKLTIQLGKITVELECVTDFVKCPTCFMRVTLKNTADKAVSERIGYILRRGLEKDLIFGAPDVYESYAPDVNVWRGMPSEWKFDGLWTDGEYFVSCSYDGFVFDEKNGTAMTDITLGANEEKEIFFSLGKGTYREFDFEAEKAASVKLWEAELGRINKLPESISADCEKLRLIKNLTVQLLQCFATCVGNDGLYARQGGLQRRVWTYEAMPMLEALTRLGDFDDYVEPVIDLYFRDFQTESGEMVPLGIHWAMATGTILYSFAKYAAVRGKEYYLKYRDRALKSFEWMKKTRRLSAYDGVVEQVEEDRLTGNYLCVEGLFPPMRSCDDPLVFQAWLTTDCNNILGLEALANTAELFYDERAAEIRAEHTEYRGVVDSAWQNLKAAAGDTDELELPYTPLGNNEEVTKRFHFSPSMGFLTNALKLPPEDYEKLFNFYKRRGFMKGGLYNRMPDKDPSIPGVVASNIDSNGRSRVWYVCAQEYGWFKCLMHHGDIERCREIVADNTKFAMSDEYYMIERYHVNDPWYAPWSPNASCSGRLIDMMLDLAYATEKQ